SILFLYLLVRLPTLHTLFPYTTLFRSVVHQRGLGELARRQVHPQPGRRAVRGRRPGQGLAAGFAQHPAPDRQDQAAAFDDVDELARRAAVAVTVVPAQQGLGRDPATAGQVDLGLEMHLELARLERVAQRALGADARDQFAVAPGVEHLAAVQARAARRERGGLGVAQQVVGRWRRQVAREGDARGDDGGGAAD